MPRPLRLISSSAFGQKDYVDVPDSNSDSTSNAEPEQGSETQAQPARPQQAEAEDEDEPEQGILTIGRRTERGRVNDSEEEAGNHKPAQPVRGRVPRERLGNHITGGIPFQRLKLELTKEFVQEARDHRPKNPMTYERLVAVVDYRRPGWGADEEQRNIASLDNCAALPRAMKSRSLDQKQNCLRLWKSCVARFRDTPDFIFSGFIRIAPRGGEPRLNGLANNIPYPGPKSVGFDELIELVNQPIWMGSIDTLRSVLAFAVACRTAVGKNFPYEFEKIDSKIPDRMADYGCEEPIWERLKKARKEMGKDMLNIHVSLLEEIVRIINPSSGGEPTAPRYPFYYDVQREDVRNVLFAINGVVSGGVRALTATDLAANLANIVRNHKQAPQEGQMGDLMRKSLLRQMYLTSLTMRGEPSVFEPGHERPKRQSETQSAVDA